MTFEHLCGTFDGLSLAAESSSSAEEVVASAATDPRAARYLSVPLGCADVDIVVHRWGFRTLRDLGTALAMERQVFGGASRMRRVRRNSNGHPRRQWGNGRTRREA